MKLLYLRIIFLLALLLSVSSSQKTTILLFLLLSVHSVLIHLHLQLINYILTMLFLISVKKSSPSDSISFITIFYILFVLYIPHSMSVYIFAVYIPSFAKILVKQLSPSVGKTGEDFNCFTSSGIVDLCSL